MRSGSKTFDGNDLKYFLISSLKISWKYTFELYFFPVLWLLRYKNNAINNTGIRQ